MRAVKFCFLSSGGTCMSLKKQLFRISLEFKHLPMIETRTGPGTCVAGFFKRAEPAQSADC